jgi:phospholipid transport system substrate-binding protein
VSQSLLALLLVAATAAPAATPREVVQHAVTKVVELIDARGNASPGERNVLSAVATARRRAQIRTIADELFDFEEVSRRALSTHWAARTPAERSEFVDLFTDLLERAYIGKIESYADEKIVYASDKIDGDFAVVRARIVPTKRKNDARTRETALEYRLHKGGAKWKVYDVVIDGVSFVSTYRSQFDRIIKASSYQTLVDRMRGPYAGVPALVERP